MSRWDVRIVGSLRAPDDNSLPIVRRDMSGGVNNNEHPSHILENQAVVLNNIDIYTKGERRKRPGSVLIGNDVGDNSVLGLANYRIQGATDQMLMFAGTSLYKWTGSGNWTSLKGDFVAPTTDSDIGFAMCKESGLSPDDVAMIYVDGNNWFRLDSAGNFQDLGSTSGTGSDSPPASSVGCWYGNRFWVLKDDLLYYSDAYSADYSSAFDTGAQAYRIPIGAERALIPTRDTGIVVFGDRAVWGLAPSATPSANDKPEPLITSWGAVSKRGVVNAGDDIYFFAQDGLRALKRTIQDKLQTGSSKPISYNIKTQFDEIAWAYIDRLAMEYFEDKILITVPISSTAFKTWVYYIATNSFTFINTSTKYQLRCWTKYKVSGRENLYYGKKGDGTVYRGWYGYTDEGTTVSDGTAITMTEEGREEDFGQPLLEKVGGEVEIEAYTSGDYDLNVYAKVDGGTYSLLGTMNLSSGTAPVLPVTLPFNLADPGTKREKFHLDSLGPFRTIQFKIENSDANTDDIKIYGLNAAVTVEEYDNE